MSEGAETGLLGRRCSARYLSYVDFVTMMRAIKFWIAIAPVLGELISLQAICATGVTFSKGELHLSWPSEQEVFKIEKASFLGSGSWELIASEVSGGAFSISSSDFEAFYRITRLGRRSKSQSEKSESPSN